MSWNYRVITNGESYAIHEVFYSENGAVEGFTENSIAPMGYSIEGLKEEFEMMKCAFDRPVIDSRDYE